MIYLLNVIDILETLIKNKFAKSRFKIKEDNFTTDFDTFLILCSLLNNLLTFQVDPNALQTASAEKESASDKRQSAANIGYVGIGLFALVFGTIFIMDISSLVRDACILFSNLREGFQRLSDCIIGKLC